ncbi:MAG: hydrogenase maturation protease [Planctomycetes bacterium]|nr:hydrogenase maturation protease [Planctomycetota bacterium]
MPGSVRIVGCGRSSLGDDRAGLVVAERLLGLGMPDTVVTGDEVPGAAFMMEQDKDVGLLIVVDAAPADDSRPAGSFARIDYRQHPDMLGARSQGSTHTLDVEVGLRLADSLGALPGQVWIYVIFGTQFDRGLELTPAVENGIAPFVERIAADVRSWRKGNTPSAGGWAGHRPDISR